jgi:NAD(P)-dependent dehydrogenase (short-subunit alcohol dehydrogenase family)
MKDLSGQIAVVTGASRGIGKGTALELGAAGATVYATGRTVDEGGSPYPGTISPTSTGSRTSTAASRDPFESRRSRNPNPTFAHRNS